MGSDRSADSSPTRSVDDGDREIADMMERHRLETEKLTLASQPFKTLKLFGLGTWSYLKQSLLFFLAKGGSFAVLTSFLALSGLALLVVDGPHEKHAQEFLHYFRFVVWWVMLGVASSIGLGSGLHTFVMYLGPHIAFFTIKAVQCGRVDLKSAPYDTIQLNRSPSWLTRNCSEFGPPQFTPPADSLVAVPLGNILPQVQIEAILWGMGTALGELPPYFISRAASLSGGLLNTVEEPSSSPSVDGWMSRMLNRTKHQLLSRTQHLNFFTILLLASVPNPLFDLAGILCGQFGIPFWKFFLATLIGKAIIKTHIQTIFVISLCNDQLLELVENELIWILRHIPGFSSVSPNLSSRLHQLREKYLSVSHVPVPKEKQWNISFNLIWNTFVWLMLLNFFAKIVISTAQGQLKKYHEEELAKMSASRISQNFGDSSPNGGVSNIFTTSHDSPQGE
ncbi:SNARE associated Golgi protein family [Wolffia australiana]